MKLYCWRNRYGSFCFHPQQPREYPEGDLASGVLPGGYANVTETAAYYVNEEFLADVQEYLPKKGECRQVELHDLWGKAKYTPSYNKRIWCDLQAAFTVTKKEETEMEDKKIKHRYSGKRSRKFWARVNRLPANDSNTLYSLGVALQNLEHQVLTELHNAEQKAQRKKSK